MSGLNERADKTKQKYKADLSASVTTTWTRQTTCGGHENTQGHLEYQPARLASLSSCNIGGMLLAGWVPHQVGQHCQADGAQPVHLHPLQQLLQ
mmetsp:Transcript_12227/g.36701  ORF Transcript_12227/g.36701 Transcript_12227/m.36701 type:complete len:94 (+) Transcript_12227:386-667(+)